MPWIKINRLYATIYFRAKSRPSSAEKGGSTGVPFSKNIIGDCNGSNFDGAHHLEHNVRF